jgi:hypothetical protein
MKKPMYLQFLEFDGSEDSEGVVCWDALAQPAARHTPALLHEVTRLLAWAHGFAEQAPGPLEDGADWDFDLQIQMAAVSIQAQWDGPTQALVLCPKPTEKDEISLSLSISGASAFSRAFRDQWNAS